MSFKIPIFAENRADLAKFPANMAAFQVPDTNFRRKSRSNGVFGALDPLRGSNSAFEGGKVGKSG